MWDYKEAENDFNWFVEKVLSKSLSGVSETLLWAILDGIYIGRVSIRHSLNDSLRVKGGHIVFDVRYSFLGKGLGSEILSKTLIVAKNMGLTKVLLTTDFDNVDSQKIILNNGGILEKKENNIFYYWITL